MGAACPRRGTQVYLSTVTRSMMVSLAFKNVTFVNFQSNSQRPAGGLSYLRQNTNPIYVLNFVQGIHLVNANAVYMDKPSRDGDKAAVFLDVDGSVTGQAGQYIVANKPILIDGACSFKGAWDSYICKHHYVSISIDSSGGQNIAPLTISRDDGVTSSQSGMDPNFVSVSALPAHAYNLRYTAPATILQIDLQQTQAGDWVQLTIPYPSARCLLYRDAAQESKISAAQSLVEFNASHGEKYFYDQQRGLLYIKLIPQAGNDWARVNVEPG
jgi:cell surface hyaluronidase